MSDFVSTGAFAVLAPDVHQARDLVPPVPCDASVRQFAQARASVSLPAAAGLAEPAERRVIASDEAQLAERFRKGDRAAFAELVRRHQRIAYAVVWRVVRNDEDAKDIAQAAFVRAWQSADTFRGDASFRTWVLRIASNLALNHVRDRGRWRADPLDDNAGDAAPLATELLGDAETQAQVARAIETLPPRQRLVVELRVQEGLSFAEVAEATASSENAAKANFHHALKRLRALLAPPAH